MKTQKGFTLIELMIVVAIVAILASIAITVYQNSTGKAQLSEAFTIVDGMKTPIAEYYNQTGNCPATGSNGLSAAASYSGKFVAQVDVSPIVAGGCTVTATMRNASISPRLQGKTVTFTLSASSGTADWQCTSNADATYLPATCQ
ncbi:pilin [Dyella choica]|uniref:Prepilin-type N-terminal cleavage/methylation domain-containing protein n=1 Tax=Dyella choica TaxID=1927959 RepID=A0A3S0SAQ8_9GAMM|nr:pilin [Dyella choica]RUL76761.1 prepilin-type N-terminal cleavage/methylation domain-containing protein [Dyella choica]